MECREVTVLELFELAVILEKDYKSIGIVHSEKYHGKYCISQNSVLCSVNSKESNQNIENRYSSQNFERPYIAICREVDVVKYFEPDYDFKTWQSHNTKVRDVYKDSLKAITDNRGMTKLQVITYNDNRMLYTLLGEIEKLTGIGVLLNTPFNLSLHGDYTRDLSTAMQNYQLDVLYVDCTLCIK